MDPAVDAGFDAAIVQKCRKSREEVISDAETVKKRNRHHAQRMRSKPRTATNPNARAFRYVVLGDARRGSVAARAAIRRADSTRRVAVARATKRGDEQVSGAIADSSPSTSSASSADALAKYVAERGGKRVIRKVLIANNGMAATKSILSMRRWAFNEFGDENAIQFLAMATPEDLAANAEFIRFADDYVEVPGGSNKNNYANVALITEIAKREGVDGVWPGWGHASENPKLPTALKAIGVQFIGPTAPVMSVLGDKIAANILAQTAKVPSIPWSGDGLVADLTPEGTIPDEIFQKAMVTTVEECVDAANRIGYPVMLKASEGGGGKGIRMSKDEEQLRTNFEQVKAEVPGSPMFMMQLCSQARHLEVQIVGDEYGNAIALNGRDCSTQRRFQKIFEEGPPTIAKPEIFKEMEKAAQRLTKNIGYIGAGTVEYLYNAATDKYFFLELNPRLQVEHPVTEGITGVNLPATQLQVAMGIPLDRIPEIRRFYNRDVEGTDSIDFMEDDYHLPETHVIAARITAENPDEGFKPTSGGIERVQFQSTPNVWGYFSVGANGGVHEFADSQFGHIFASGRNRNEARKALVLALKGMVVRGEIRTAVEYLVQLLETEEFKENTIDTSWLDGLIAKKEIANKQDPHMIVLGAALFRAFKTAKAEEEGLTEFWKKGQVSIQGVDKMIHFPIEITYQDVKYSFDIARLGPDAFEVTTPEGQKIEAKIRERADGALVTMFGGQQHEIEGLEEPLGLRMILDGQTWLLPNIFDPSELRTDVTGKLIRFLQDDGAEVVAGKPFAEVEAMKMVMPLIATESGKVSHAKSGGAVIEAGDLLATIELKDPSKVKKISTFSGELRIPNADEAPASPEEALEAAVNRVNLFLDGYNLDADECLSNLFNCLTALPADQGRWDRAVAVLDQVITRYISVESVFEGKKIDSVMAQLIRSNSSNLAPVLNQVRAHTRSTARAGFIVSLLKQAPTLPQRVISRGPISWADDHAPISDSLRQNIEKLSKLRGSIYGDVALQASNILLERRLPSIDKRLEELKSILLGSQGLSRQWGSTKPGDLQSLVESPTLAVDLLPVLFKDKDAKVQDAALEVYCKRVYRAHNVISTQVQRDDAMTSISWNFKFNTYPDESPLRCGLLARVNNLADAKERFPAILAQLESSIKQAGAQNDQMHVLHIAMSQQEASASLPGDMEAYIATQKPKLEALGVKFVNVLAYANLELPSYYTFHSGKDFKEDMLYRGERPTVAHLLELARLENYGLTRLPTVNRDLHMYVGESSTGTRRGPAKHMLLRRLSHSKDVMEGGLERVLDKALEALSLSLMDSRSKGASSSRIYVNFLPHLESENIGTAVSALKNKLLDFISRQSATLLASRVDEIEVRVRVGKEKVPLRLMATSMSGQWLKVDMYKEYLEPTTGRADQFCLLGSNGEEQACFLEPYPQPGALQQKRAVARAIGTTYIFDFLGLFEKALVLNWRKHIADVGGSMPTDFFSASELVLGEDGKLTKEQRPAGSNNVGMVGWHCFMKTPEYPEGREIVIVGNDCTYMSGSFGVKEDDVYDAISKYARNLGLPRIYIASNSGARIGLVEELKPYFKVAWIDDTNPGMGFRYLYLTPEDYKAFPEGTVKAEEIIDGNETRMKLTDIIGQIHGIGVENLRGSGMIAGEQSAAYADAFTLSYVSGRSVGIGAYLCRLGQRNIQMTNGPLILTGYLALNKLLGREVYTSQDQLGGPQVMMPNGVSHLQVSDDQDGVKAILNWLSYVPATSKSQARALKSSDPVDRDIEFMPTKTPYDPRHMLAGVAAPEGFSKGFFDVDSWTETLPEWGKSVVTGRARLGGIPCGVIAVETRLMEQRIPADPANPESREAVLAQAGQVWFPDSAHKTATAIRDFNNAENLPLFIFANWRGFSGGTRDMYGEILKFGAMIVDELRVYRHPVFIYIPPNGELRGGAWVVVDPTINEARMEMYADVDSRGGILEPPGICEVKFRSKDQLTAMHRLDPILATLDEDPEANKDEIKKRENALLPMYTQVAHEFADLHDRSGRMKAKGVIRDVVDWKNARRYFHARLQRRLAVDALASRIKEQLGEVELEKSLVATIEDAIAASIVDANDDRAVVAMLESDADKVTSAVLAKGRAAKVNAYVAALKGMDAESLAAIKSAL